MKKIVSIMLLSLLLVTVFADVASATISSVTINAPSASTAVKGTVTFNVSWIGDQGADESGNITIYYNSTGTPLIDTSLRVCAVTNLSAANTSKTCTFNTATVSDATNYSFIAAAYNGTGTNEANSSVVSNVELDNTAPTATITVDYSTISVYEQVIATCTVTDAIDSTPTISQNFTKPSLTVISGGSASTATYSLTDTDEVGESTAACSGTDNAGNKANANTKVTVNSKSLSALQKYLIIGTGGVRDTFVRSASGRIMFYGLFVILVSLIAVMMWKQK